MSNTKPWVAGVLTLVPLATGTTSASATAPSSPFNESLTSSNGEIENFETDELDILLKPATIASNSVVETTNPEFSPSLISLGELNPDYYLPKTSKTPLNQQKQPIYNYNNNVSKLIPKSGAQLYQQRQASLREGRLHSRIDPSSFQNSWIKASTQPTHQQWQRLLAQEARVMAQSQGSNRLNILLGDSLTLWYPSEGLSQDKFWLNQGISGENSGHIVNRLDAFAQTRADTIYLMAGINDIRNGKSDYEILSNMRNIISELRQTHPHADIVVQSILPTRRADLSNSRIQQLNYHIQNIAQEEGANYLNLYNIFTDSTGQLNVDYTTDGLHLSPQGYQVWQNALQETENWLNYHL